MTRLGDTPRAAAAARLRDMAVRLAAELDEARLHQAAAYASMVADAIDYRRGRPVNGHVLASEVELEFELDEHGRVWMIWDGECHIIGRRLPVCDEMRRFLATARAAG